LSSGGAGTIYEYRVAAVVLAALLRGDRVIGLEVPLTGVRLQQRIAGSYLDDVIAVADHPGAARLQVDIQVKRTADPVRGDREWKSVVGQCLATLAEDPDGVRNRHHLLALAARAPAGHLEELAELSRWARQHDNPASFTTVITAPSGAPNAAVRNRWGHLRMAITDVLAEESTAPTPTDAEVREAAFWIAHALHVWVVEAEAGERDHLETLNRLGDLTPPDQPEAAENVFLRLADIAEARGPRAGGITVAALRAELERRLVLLPADRRHEADLAELDRWTAGFLGATRDTMAGMLHLPRTDLLGRISDAIGKHEQVLVTGRAGTGKSVLARLAARDKHAGATVVAFSLTERSWRTLADVEAELHVRLETAMAAAATTGTRLLLIDGAEQVLTDGGALLRSLLGVVPRAPDASPWRLLITARDEAADAVAGVMAQCQPTTVAHQMTIGDLTDDEVGEVTAAFPQLRPLDRHERPRRLLLRRPYLVDLLVRGSTGTGLPEGMLGEEDVISLVYERLIRRDEGALPGKGAPDARSDVYLEMADAVISGNSSARLTGRDALARAGLVSDNILDRDGASVRFSHDVLADYAVATLLLEAGGIALISTPAQPRRLLRGIRLWMQCKLADAATIPAVSLPRTWAEVSGIASTLAAADGPRWLDVPFEALLNIGPVTEALRQLTAPLSVADGAGIARLIDVTQRHAPHRDSSGPDTDATLFAPVVNLLAGLGDVLPVRLHPSAARLVCSHLRSLPSPPDGTASELVPCAAGLPAAVIAWAENCRLDREERDAVEAIVILAAYLDEAGEEFLVRYARRDAEHIGEALEESLACSALARFRPHLLFRLSMWYFLGRDPDASGGSGAPRPRWARKGYDRLDREGVRPHALQRGRIRPAIDEMAHPDRGPFSALLRTDTEYGLRLVGAVVDAATEARTRAEAGWGQAEAVLGLRLAHWPETHAYRGTPSSWGWYRRLGVGDFPAMSALMALGRWAGGRRRDGVTLREVVDDILRAGTSLAIVAVAVAVLVHDINQVTDELDPFLASPLIWDMEITRALGELGGPAIRGQDWQRADWTISHAARALVLTSGSERQHALRRVGGELAGRWAELAGAETSPLAGLVPDLTEGDPREIARLQARRWATELDIDHYRTKQDGRQRTTMIIDYPGDVVAGLAEAGGRSAHTAVDITGLMYRAVLCRDGKNGHDPVQLHSELTRAREELAAAGPQAGWRHEAEAVAAVAATLILGPSRGADIPGDCLTWAARELLGIAQQQADTPLPRYGTPNQSWYQAADRSAATALPVLLADPALPLRAGTDIAAVSAAVIALGGSFYTEVRERLSAGLRPILEPCEDADPAARHAAVNALREMIATSGLGLGDGGSRQHIRLPEPFTDAIASDEFRLDTELAAPAIPGLAAASGSQRHPAAAELLEAVIAYDLARWPAEYARRNYADTDDWRRELDQVTAGHALDGNPALLHRYLAAFSPVAEDLRGILTAMADLAVTPERITALHRIWPALQDVLLPPHRQLQAFNGRKAQDHDVELLDEALLPLPPETTSWPTEQTSALIWRWVGAYRARPRLAARLITVLERLRRLFSPQATQAVLAVLGTDIPAIKHHPGRTVSWLRFVLAEHPEVAGTHKAAAQNILDGLARAGHETALKLQHEMEA